MDGNEESLIMKIDNALYSQFSIKIMNIFNCHSTFTMLLPIP